LRIQLPQPDGRGFVFDGSRLSDPRAVLAALDAVDIILQELRASITTKVKGLTPSDTETLALQADEHVQQLLDQIEGLVRRQF